MEGAVAGFHLAGSSNHPIALAEDRANSRVKNGPWAVGQKMTLHLKFWITAVVSAVQFLVTFSKNICSKLRLLTKFLKGRTKCVRGF